eukprot:102316_1
MTRFNATLQNNDRNGYQRCVICIMLNGKGYIFEPLTSQSVPSKICNYTEIPWICNTKSDILPHLNTNDYDVICVSLHRHVSFAERVYLSYGDYCTRVYKHNLITVLRILCVNEDDGPGWCDFNWSDEIRKHEFKDDQYHAFIQTYFADLKLIVPDLNSYLIEQLCKEHKWSKLWRKYFVSDRSVGSVKSEHSYMYSPTAMEYYEHINSKVNEYYKSHGVKTKHDQFMNYIVENGLEDCSLEENLGLHKNVNDCVLLEFDKDFPMMDSSMDRECFIFRLLQNVYFLSFESDMSE